MISLLGGVADLDDAMISRLLARASELQRTDLAVIPRGRPAIVGLAFLEASLRTRVGFAVAAARLGWTSVEVNESRASATSQPEPWTETLRVLSGMVDVVVARPGRPLDFAETRRWSAAPFVNGGDAGLEAEHPTQAMIDLFAIEQFVGPIGELTVAVCGDLRTRCARSLLRLLERRRPERLVIVSDSSLGIDLVPASLTSIVVRRNLPDVADVDVMMAIGLPDGSAPAELRRRLQVDRTTMDRLPDHGVVLSPMPVLDEVETVSLDHPRLHVYAQSDLGVAMRMAVLEAAIS